MGVNWRTVGSVVLLAAIGFAWPLAQGILPPQELGDCELDVRPKVKPDGSSNMEAQVYWEEIEDPANQRYGTRFTIHTPADEHLEIQDHKGESLVVMFRSKEYVVDLFWDELRDDSYIVIVVDGDTASPVVDQVTRHSGSYDAFTPFADPTWATMIPSADELDRIRFTSSSRAVETRFAIESR